MGSSGSGSFSDYSGRSKEQDGSGSSGGSSGEDKCRQAFTAGLEDVALYGLYADTGTVPAPGSILTLILDRRVIAVDSSGARVGALPTRLNYLASCLADGVRYSGIVTSSSTVPVPQVDADFAPA